MKKEEFEEKIKMENLIEVYDDDIKKIYIDSDRVIKDGRWISNEPNVYGCYRGTNSFVTFMTDDDRGVAYWGSSYDTEDDAYDALYEYLKLLDQIFKEDHGFIR